MQSRRQFVATTALGLGPFALTLKPGAAVAQSTGADPAAARVMRQIAAQSARIFNEARRSGVRAEHLRAAAANLRVLAALDLDGEVRTGVQRHVRQHGRHGLPKTIDREMLRREMRQLGMNLTGAEADRAALALEPTTEALEQVVRPSFSYSEHLRSLADTLDINAATMARTSDGPIRRVVALDCRRIAFQSNMLTVGAGVLCGLSGGLGCAAAWAGIVLIWWVSYEAGC